MHGNVNSLDIIGRWLCDAARRLQEPTEQPHIHERVIRNPRELHPAMWYRIEGVYYEKYHP